MRRTTLLLASMVLTLLVIGGVAWAATVNCQVGVDCVGTNQPDRLVGTNQPDDMRAKQDDDVLLGHRGDDRMFGDNPFAEDSSTDGDDKLYGNEGEDLLAGAGGSDLLRGGRRADRIDARDSFTNNPGEDTVFGDGGRDFIFAEDGFKDTIDCGDNVDSVAFDVEFDVVADNCENQNPLG
jgi:Ca2+-binding RTX toxin-like protein